MHLLNSFLLLEQIGTEHFLCNGLRGFFVVIVKLVKSQALRFLAEQSSHLAFSYCRGRVIILVGAEIVGY